MGFWTENLSAILCACEGCFGDNVIHITVFGEEKISKALKEFCSSLCCETLAELSASLLGMDSSYLQSLLY